MLALVAVFLLLHTNLQPGRPGIYTNLAQARYANLACNIFTARYDGDNETDNLVNTQRRQFTKALFETNMIHVTRRRHVYIHILNKMVNKYD